MKTPEVVLLLLVAGIAGCTSGGDPDPDRDQLENSEETRGWYVEVDLMERRVRYHVTSDPQMFDTDGDGLSDYDEYIRGLDPRNRDTDGDGLTDCQEAVHSVAAECEDPSFNGEDDGGTGTDPLNADSDATRGRYLAEFLEFFDETGTLSGTLRPNGDGISDGDEVNGFTITLPGGRTRFVQTDPRSADTDKDALDDGAERYLAGSDPLVYDTDGDGCQDGLDVYPGHHERYTAGLVSFRFTGPSAQDLAVWAHVVDQDQFVPDADGYERRQPGELWDLQSRTTPVRATFCNYNIWDPWAVAELTVFARNDDGAVRTLDFFSDVTPAVRPGVANVWWNLRTGELAWTRDGVQVDSPVTLTGPDGELVLAPRVLDVQ